MASDISGCEEQPATKIVIEKRLAKNITRRIETSL
jgi:hypothetical protein